MYDPELNLVFNEDDVMNETIWWPYPAIWSINEQRKGARSGVDSWPQENIPISRFQAYNRSRSFRDTID